MLLCARFVPPLLIAALLLRCGGVASANDGRREPSPHEVRTAPDCADKCAAMVGDFVRHATPAEIQGAVRSAPWLRTSLTFFCKRLSLGQPRPREELSFCQLTASRLLALSPPHRLLFEMKAACSQVDFIGVDPIVCEVRSTEEGNAPRWLAQFSPLHPKLQQALDARRGNFPARDLLAGNSIVMNRGDVDEVWRGFVNDEEVESKQQLCDDPTCLPPVDPHQMVYASCAVVGSGGSSLREPRGGAAIDRHEAVFRFNRAQTAGYEGFVGSKTTIRLGNIRTTRTFLKAIEKSTQPNARAALSEQGWDGDEYIHWPSDKYAATLRSACNVMHDPAFYVMRPTLLRNCREFYREICNLIRTHQSPEAQRSFRQANRESSGVIGVITALTMCEQVHLFGFDMDQPVELRNNFKHYFNNGTVTHQHDYHLMDQFFKVLHVGGFLRICSPFHLEDAPMECFFPRRRRVDAV